MSSIYLGSIAMEKNRWAPGRVPTYKVSEYAKRAVTDGFAGVELWENHYHLADDSDMKALQSSEVEYVFNTYFNLAEGFGDEIKAVADAVNSLDAVGVKYNFAHIDYGVDQKALTALRDTLLRFADMLSPKVKLLCECHAWTAMEVPERAAGVFETLDERFGAIVHLAGDRNLLENCFECYGERICHIHTAASLPEGGGFTYLESMAKQIEPNMIYILSKGFNGTMTTEFIADADNMEKYYENALKDLNYLKTIYK